MVRSVKARLPRITILYRVLIANITIVVLGAVFGTFLTARVARTLPEIPAFELVLYFALAGVGISLLANLVILNITLRPLAGVQKAWEKIRHGHAEPSLSSLHRIPAACHACGNGAYVGRLVDVLANTLDATQAYREQLQRLSSQVISAQEEERKRIARDLHDETAQALTSLLVRAKIVEKTQNPQEVQERLAEFRELITSTLEGVRKLVVELRPTALDDLGLVAALHWYTREFSDKLQTRVQFQAEGFNGRLPAQVELVLYRVVQEALTNIGRHAGATRVSVVLRRSGQAVTALVEDNGRGFDLNAVLSSKERGLGIFGMQERVALVGGNLKLESRPGGGTRVMVEVPLAKAGG